MATKHSAIYVGNTSVIELDGLADHEGNYENDATVTLESLADKESGAAVTGVSVPVTLNYVSGSNGKYQASVPPGIEITAGALYSAVVKAVSAGGLQAQWTETLVAKVREA